MKFSTGNGIGEVKGDQIVTRNLPLTEMNEKYAKEKGVYQPEDWEKNRRKAKDGDDEVPLSRKKTSFNNELEILDRLDKAYSLTNH